MFIELVDVLKCPADHEESYLVCVPVEMRERRVVRGGIGCPVCGAEYPIVDGIVHFGPLPTPHSPVPVPVPVPVYDAPALQAFLALEGRGGYVLLAGQASRHAARLADLLPGVHVVVVNPAPDVPLPDTVSVLVSPRGLPVKTQSVRAVVLGADWAAPPWLGEGVRALLAGLRCVVEDAAAEPAGITPLARAAGLLVGEKEP